jgi:hypothetical protein
VGIVAFSNLRYGGLFDAVGEALAALSQTGGLTPRSRAERTPSTPGRRQAVFAVRSISAIVAAKRVSTTVQRCPRVSTLRLPLPVVK